ncbi:hypothetical protein [Candidatus Paracaedibacter symbiosus]|uniref:hypothetical protein n=1 Tax=Candidatus Paracaedibacter symbiosus TaxID=244582 RepID=UPI000509C3B4|nr:hypothetical protein [Candidatus Paracaedibacter symbiosus]
MLNDCFRILCYLIAAIWTSWFSVVMVADCFDLLKVLGFLGPDFIFVSKNYTLLINFTSIYQFQDKAVLVLYITLLIFCLPILCGMFFGFLQLTLQKKPLLFAKALLTLTALNGSFVVLDEIFLNYEMEHWHLVRFGMLLLSTFIFLSAGQHSFSCEISQK